MKKITSELILRGVAITAVVGVHFLAGLPSYVYTSAPWQPLVVFLDQFSRMSVPMFVALSGFGLSLKYQNQPFNWSSFLQRRVLKLLPLYVLWSGIFYVVFWIIPSWRPSNTPSSFLTQLIWGQADYQLYFVPMIFQLYLLFPFLHQLVKRWPAALVLGSLIFQVGLYAWFTQLADLDRTANAFASDQQQYVWCVSWIFYFVLGMALAQLKLQRHLKYLLGLLAVSLAVGGLAWATWMGIWQINQGIDPIIALRFTRWPVLVYAGGFVGFAVLYSNFLVKVSAWGRKVLVFLGTHSYVIYLSHTLILRAFFSLIN